MFIITKLIKKRISKCPLIFISIALFMFLMPSRMKGQNYNILVSDPLVYTNDLVEFEPVFPAGDDINDFKWQYTLDGNTSTKNVTSQKYFILKPATTNNIVVKLLKNNTSQASITVKVEASIPEKVYTIRSSTTPSAINYDIANRKVKIQGSGFGFQNSDYKFFYNIYCKNVYIQAKITHYYVSKNISPSTGQAGIAIRDIAFLVFEGPNKLVFYIRNNSGDDYTKTFITTIYKNVVLRLERQGDIVIGSYKKPGETNFIEIDRLAVSAGGLSTFGLMASSTNKSYFCSAIFEEFDQDPIVELSFTPLPLKEGILHNIDLNKT